jgi:hypothetical protein
MILGYVFAAIFFQSIMHDFQGGYSVTDIIQINKVANRYIFVAG